MNDNIINLSQFDSLTAGVSNDTTKKINSVASNLITAMMNLTKVVNIELNKKADNIDLSNYISKEELQSILEDYLTKSDAANTYAIKNNS